MTRPSPQTLTVHQLRYVDVYTDAIRVHKDERCGVQEGRICKVSVGVVSHFFAMRGLPDSELGMVRLDEIGRDRLGLDRGQTTSFVFREAYFWEALCWAAKASQPSARIATWIAIWSGIFGLIGLGLAGWSIWLALNSCP